jgi:preprotein translocase subunit SecE
MARIQKKKTGQRQRKQKKAETAEQAVANRAEAVEADRGGDAAVAEVPRAGREEKNKKTLPLKKASGLEQSAIIKKLDQYFGPWIQFLREVKVELSKVTWPSRNQTIGSTVVVIIFVFIIALFLGVVDFGLSSLIRFII